MKQIMTPTQKDAIRGVIAGRSEIIAVYLYGSFVEGVENILSDIDFAMILREPLVRSAFDIRMEFLVEFARIFPEREIDVQVLTHETSLPFLQEVLRDRILLVVNDEEYSADFESGATQNILDFQPVVDEYLDAMQDRLKRGTYAS